MGETLAKDRFVMPQPFFGTTQFQLDVLHIKTTNILEFDALEQVPDAFLRIQLWSIGRQAFEMNPFGSTFCQKVFDGLTTVNGGSIPDHQKFPGDLPQEQLQEANHVRAFVRMVLGLHEYPSFWSDATHCREMVTGQLDFHQRRLAHRGIRAYSHRQEIKGRLISKDNGT